MASSFIKYTVRRGDSLYRISEKYYLEGFLWPMIYSINKSIVGKNPDLILEGQVLRLPNNILMKEKYRKKISGEINKD